MILTNHEYFERIIELTQENQRLTTSLVDIGILSIKQDDSKKLEMDSQNKRIAKNTIYMYVRLFATMFIGLYTSRVVLQVLGVSDYGLFSVVGGVISMFTFICDSLGGACSRFLNAEMGKKDGNVNRIFCVNVFLHVAFSATIFVLLEIFGMWYIYNKLTIDPNQLEDAVFVFQVSTITSCVGITNAPYKSLFGAHERFKFLAEFDILNTLLRFCCILLLQIYHGHYALRLYSLIMCLTTANTFIVYHWIAKRDWSQIVKLRFVKEWSIYKEVLSFLNWNLLHTLSTMARSSGSDLLLNRFFGTLMNGAFAISNCVNGYVQQFASNFDSASGPQIVQSYAAGNKERYTYLVNKMGRFGILLFLIVFFPLYIELELILQLWLGEVPEHAVLLTRLNLILAAVSLSGGGIFQLINASGKIKWFKIEHSFFFLSCLPVAYYLFRFGFPAYYILVIFSIADALQRIVQLILLKTILRFDTMRFVREAYSRPALIIIIMSAVLLLYWRLDIENVWIKLLAIFFCAILSLSLVYGIGLTKGEKATIMPKILMKLHLQ